MQEEIITVRGPHQARRAAVAQMQGQTRPCRLRCFSGRVELALYRNKVEWESDAPPARRWVYQWDAPVYEAKVKSQVDEVWQALCRSLPAADAQRLGRYLSSLEQLALGRPLSASEG